MSKWTIHHPAVFVLTFSSYAFFHAVRKTLSNVKSTVAEEWTPQEADSGNGTDICYVPDAVWNRHHFLPSHDSAKKFLGVLDASFLFAYAAGLYVSGYIADRQDLRIVLSMSMWFTALTVFLFGPVFEWLEFYSMPAYIVVMVINGLLQSMAWPSVVAVMGNWFGKGSRGFVLGLWSACQSVGNIIGALLTSMVVDFGYEYAFLLNACILFAGGVVVFFGLVPTPREVGLPVPDEEGAIDKSKMMSMELVVNGANADNPATTTTNSNNDDDNNNARVYGALSVEYKAIENAKECAELSSTGKCQDGASPGAKAELQTNKIENGLCVEDPSSKGAALDSNKHKSAIVTLPNSNSNDAEFNGITRNFEHVSHTHDTRPQAVTFCTALLLPGVIPYSLAYGFLKMVNYSFFFWLPFYLSNAYNWRESTADQLSTWYDVGGIIGGTVAGFLSDRLQKRAMVVVPMLVLGIPMLFIYSSVEAGDQMLVNAVMLCCTGLLVGGVANLISAAISADLGRQEAIRGNSEALSTVTGIVDGTGSLGAAIGQMALPYLQVDFGWRSVFYLFMAAILLTIICVLPILVGEVKEMWRHKRRQGKCQG